MEQEEKRDKINEQFWKKLREGKIRSVIGCLFGDVWWFVFVGSKFIMCLENNGWIIEWKNK